MDYFDTVRLWRVPSILLPFLICLGLIVFVDVFLMRSYTIAPLIKLHIDDEFETNRLAVNDEREQHKGFLIKTPGCRLPDLNPFDKTVESMIKDPDVPICNSGLPALFHSNLTTLYLLDSSLDAYNVTTIENLSCCYREIYRVDPPGEDTDDIIKTEKHCYLLSRNQTEITKEFIKLMCTYNGTTIYTDFFSFVPVKVNSTEKGMPNVLVFGLDSVSRVNLQRQLPLTVKYLKSLNTVDLLGYNKVADNTFPNLIPVLTGMFEGELKNSCWPEQHSHFDNCSFLWKLYKQKGYVTGFGEDCSFMGIFNYQKRGFSKQPTDYGYGYFNRHVESQIGNSHNMNVKECIGSRFLYQEFLGYIKKFITRMELEQQPYFAFFWASALSHDYLNQVKLGDKDYYEFFKHMNDSNYLNNTIVVFMSDHGMRWGDIRTTFIGRMEERLPYVHIILPDWFKATYRQAYRNLQINQYRLTTPFDLHETLKSFTNLSSLEPEYLHELQNNSRGFNLFKPITKERTCESAEIAAHWCTCQKSVPISSNDSEVKKVAKFAVRYINKMLELYPNCMELDLDEILDARIMTHEDEILHGHKAVDYTIIIRTNPGDALFETTIRKEDDEFSVMGTISRLNLYGQQSACMTDFHLKLYCYCSFS